MTSLGQDRRQLQQHELEVLAWLSPTAFTNRQQAVLKRVQPETGEWLPTHNNFSQRIKGHVASQRLWLSGIPGSGKTSLAALVIDYLEKKFTQGDVGITYIFCGYKDTTQSYESLKSVVLRQLLQRIDSLPKEVEKLYQDYAKKNQQTRTLSSLTKHYAP